MSTLVCRGGSLGRGDQIGDLEGGERRLRGGLKSGIATVASGGAISVQVLLVRGIKPVVNGGKRVLSGSRPGGQQQHQQE